MKKKQLAAIFAVAALGLSLLAGCGNKDQKAAAGDVASESDGVEEDLGESGDITVSLDNEDSGNEKAESEEGEEVLDESAESEGDKQADPNLVDQSDVIDEENNIEFNFQANKTDVGELPDKAEMTESAGDLDNARWESLKVYYDGVEEDAKEELDELRETAPIGSDQLALIQPYYPQIARYFEKARIKHYDMTKPFYTDTEEIDYDVYTDSYVTYYLTVYLNESGKIESFEMIEENLVDGDESVDIDGDDADADVIELDGDDIEIDDDDAYIDDDADGEVSDPGVDIELDDGEEVVDDGEEVVDDGELEIEEDTTEEAPAE